MNRSVLQGACKEAAGRREDYQLDTPLSVSVVIPTLNGGGLFARLMEGLSSQRLTQTLEIVVIDSGSSDDTVGVARSHGARVEEIGKHQFNHGLTRNRGIELTSGEVIVLFSQDAVPADQFLIANLVAHYRDPALAGAYARQVARPEHDVLTRRNVAAHVAGRSEAYVRHLAEVRLSDMAPIERYLFCNFDNVCSSIRRAAWQQVQFRSVPFGEDLDWAKRALELGWKIAYEPSATVVHSHDRSNAYEYRRTYLCHQELYRLFGVRTIPRRRDVLRSVIHSLKTDCAYVVGSDASFREKVAVLASLPATSLVSALAQHRGGMDASAGRRRRYKGV